MFKTTVKTISKELGEATADPDVLSLVRRIEDRINDARHNNLTSVDVDLPLMFDSLKSLDMKTQQTIVYGRLLTELDTAGFKSTIMFYKDSTIITVMWPPALNKTLQKELYDTITKHSPQKMAEKNKNNAGSSSSERHTRKNNANNYDKQDDDFDKFSRRSFK
jgi:hypothetical protein